MVCYASSFQSSRFPGAVWGRGSSAGIGTVVDLEKLLDNGNGTALPSPRYRPPYGRSVGVHYGGEGRYRSPLIESANPPPGSSAAAWRQMNWPLGTSTGINRTPAVTQETRCLPHDRNTVLLVESPQEHRFPRDSTITDNLESCLVQTKKTASPAFSHSGDADKTTSPRWWSLPLSQATCPVETIGLFAGKPPKVRATLNEEVDPSTIGWFAPEGDHPLPPGHPYSPTHRKVILEQATSHPSQSQLTSIRGFPTPLGLGTTIRDTLSGHTSLADCRPQSLTSQTTQAPAATITGIDTCCPAARNRGPHQVVFVCAKSATILANYSVLPSCSRPPSIGRETRSPTTAQVEAAGPENCWPAARRK
jgi:hypothetical protein